MELRGVEGLGRKLRIELFGPSLTLLLGTLQDAVRMAFMKSSRPRGTMSRSVEAAGDVQYVGRSLRDDTTLLHFKAPAFGSVAAELFDGPWLWDDIPKAEDTAFESLAGTLRDVRERRKDSDRFDPAFLLRIGRYGKMLGGDGRIDMPDTTVEERGGIDATTVLAANELRAATPGPRPARVVGRLGAMGTNQHALKLEVEPGVILATLWEGPQPLESLTKFFDQNVILAGASIFRPSGTLLRLDADVIALARAEDEVFRQVPEGNFAPGSQNGKRLASVGDHESTRMDTNGSA